MNPKNPFVVLGYCGPEYFCDRERETQKMLQAIQNDRNMTLIAPRRYGKTGLIRNVFHLLPKDVSAIYLDIFATRDLSEFTSLLASEIVGALDSPVEKTLSTVTRFFQSCRPTITPQEDGFPKFSFDVAPSQAKATLKETFNYLKRHERRVVIAIDEFQQILDYPERGTEALLRGYVQDIPWVRFIFAGSRHHLMGEMFLTAKRPFYQSTDILSLDVINKESYRDFARRHFKDAKQPFSDEAFDSLYTRFSGITWYVQAVLNRIWQDGNGFLEVSQIDQVVDDFVQDRSLLFRDLFFSQNESAQSLLIAIAKDGEAKKVYSGEFQASHALKSTSTIRSALKGLLESDLVYQTESGYVIYDRIFNEWLRKR